MSLYTLAHLMSTSSQVGKGMYFHAHLTDEKSKAPKSESSNWAKPALKYYLLNSRLERQISMPPCHHVTKEQMSHENVI